MKKNLAQLIALGLLALPLAGTLRAVEDPNAAAEKRLRDTLRNTMLQLRTAQNEQSALQAAQTELEEKNKELTKKTEDLTKELAKLQKTNAAEKDASAATITTLTGKVDAQEKEGVRLNASLEKWKEGYAKAVDVAKTKDSERAVLASKVVTFERRVAVRDVKNAEMFKLGSEILKRYEKFGLGTALAAREPFVGVSRIKMQNMVQDYQDKLIDQKIKAADDSPPAATAPAATDKPKASDAEKDKSAPKAKA